MNIFFLSKDPKQAALFHNDKHVVKMILESAQLLCTTHRVLDGKQEVIIKNNRKKKAWKLSNSELDLYLYNSTHVNHPSAVWVRESKNNYMWLYNLFVELCKEYKYRYGKTHLCETKLKKYLMNPPMNISNRPFTQPPQAMPEQYRQVDSVSAYRNYYMIDKAHLASWKNRNIPDWFNVR